MEHIEVQILIEPLAGGWRAVLYLDGKLECSSEIYPDRDRAISHATIFSNVVARVRFEIQREWEKKA